MNRKDKKHLQEAYEELISEGLLGRIGGKIASALGGKDKDKGKGNSEEVDHTSYMDNLNKSHSLMISLAKQVVDSLIKAGILKDKNNGGTMDVADLRASMFKLIFAFKNDNFAGFNIEQNPPKK
jgi:hypothetical protein